MDISISVHTHVCTFSKSIDINKKKESMSNKESISDHGYERTNMAAKCEIL